MEIEKIYNRLAHDVFAHFYPDVYLLNQEGDINQFNTFKKKGWKYYFDGGCVIKRMKDYQCSYSFDFKYSGGRTKRTSSFCSYSESSSLNLLRLYLSSLVNDKLDIVTRKI